MKVNWLGFHIEGIPALKAVHSEFGVDHIFTLSNEHVKKRSGVGDYEEAANSLSIPISTIDHINDASSIDFLKESQPDILIVLGWSQILSEEVLRIPSIGTIGAHASLLPTYRGSAPINWAIINDIKKTGNTLMWLNPGVDSGDIIDQEAFDITPYDTCNTLYSKVANTSELMLLRSLPKIIDGKEKIGTPQAYTDDPILPRRKPKDGLIDFSKTAKELYNFVRALTRPYPGAFFTFKQDTYKIWNASAVDFGISTEKGYIVDHIYNPAERLNAIAIGTGSGLLLVYELENQTRVFTGRELHQHFPIGSKLNS